MANVGRFVWYELESSAPEIAAKFYTELIGWTVQEMAMGDTTYRMIVNDGTPIAGFGSLRDASLPARWTSWNYVEDLEASNAKAKELGAKVVHPTTQIPPGPFSVIEDPQGAELVLFQMSDAPGAKSDGPAAAGSFGWTELHVADPGQGARFYADLLDYNVSEFPMGGPEPYRILSVGEANEAGVSGISEGSPGGAPTWLPYIAVSDIDACHQRAEALGASTVNPPSDVPGVGRFAIIADPTGAEIAIMRFGD